MSKTGMVSLNWDALKIDAEEEAGRIGQRLREVMRTRIKRRGIVVGLSGGIDSTVTVALCARALGKERVLGLLMPERDSSGETLRLSRLVADHLGIASEHEDITPILEATGCYRRYDEAVRMVFPDYGAGWTSKITISNVLDNSNYTLFSIVVQSPAGEVVKKHLPLNAYLGIVAATNFKQRVRKMLEYYHADRLNYAVAGTPNRLEYDQGFFVKNGDGAADVKPIAHLYKSQVYQMAEYLGIPGEITNRPPSTDTYSMAQGQDEFYFSLPYDKMDLCLYAKENGHAPESVAEAAGLNAEQVRLVFDDIDRKRAATAYLHAPPVLLVDIPSIRHN